jgi:predicted GNAT family N-acyltransferase
MNISISKVSCKENMQACFIIRKEVFIEGQNVPVELEVDGLDKESGHYILRLDNIASGTARVRYIQNKAKIERVAILAKHQGKGLGKKLMEYIIEDIKASNKAKNTFLEHKLMLLNFMRILGLTFAAMNI